MKTIKYRKKRAITCKTCHGTGLDTARMAFCCCPAGEAGMRAAAVRHSCATETGLIKIAIALGVSFAVGSGLLHLAAQWWLP